MTSPKQNDEVVIYPPVVQELRTLDDEYLRLEQEFTKKMVEIQNEYAAKQAPLLVKRADILEARSREDADSEGTPGVSDFWLKVLKRSGDFRDDIEEWDEPVLHHLRDITFEYLPDETGRQEQGFSVSFKFGPNPYFTNTVLTKHFHTKCDPYTGSSSLQKVVLEQEIEWNQGQNVTVEITQKKRKGGGAKKKKPTTKEVPRASFFRRFFRSFDQDMEPPMDLLKLLRGDEGSDDEDEDDEEDDIVEMIMDDDMEKATALKDSLIPYAVRWYTGEAGDSDDDEDSDDDFDEDSEDESEEEESVSPAKKKGGQKPQSGGARPQMGGAEAGKANEECKQQ